MTPHLFVLILVTVIPISVCNTIENGEVTGGRLFNQIEIRYK